jgi:hypothetical protein
MTPAVLPRPGFKGDAALFRVPVPRHCISACNQQKAASAFLPIDAGIAIGE